MRVPRGNNVKNKINIMKLKQIITLLMFMALIGFVSCSPEEPPAPTPNISLSPNSVEMTVEESVTVIISGGSKEKGYAFSPSTSDIVGIKLNGNRLELTAKKVGSLTIKIQSADQSAQLQVTVKEKPVPSLQGGLGIYALEANQPLFTSKYLAKNKDGIWLSPNVVDPYQKRAFLAYVSKTDAQIGKEIKLKVRFPEKNETEERTVRIEKVLGTSVQLLGETHRFVTEIK